MAKEISNLITFNTYKFERGGLLVDMFNQFNARVGDQGTELAIQWETSKTETKINLKERGLHFFGTGSVGQYLEKLEDGTGFKMSADASTVEWEDKDEAGSLDDGITVVKLPKQFFPQKGIFFGYFGLKDRQGNIFTSVNVWFRVLGGVPTMGAAIPYFVTEFDEVLERCNGKIVDALAELREKYQAEVKKNEDMSAETRAALSKLADAVGAIQAQINAGNVVTLARHEADYNELKDNQTILKDEVRNQLSKISFHPETFPTLAAIQAQYPKGTSNICVSMDNKHGFVWNGTTCEDIGVVLGDGLSNEEQQVLHNALHGKTIVHDEAASKPPYNDLNSLEDNTIVTYATDITKIRHAPENQIAGSTWGATVITMNYASSSDGAGRVQFLITNSADQFVRVQWGSPITWSEWKSSIIRSYPIIYDVQKAKAPFNNLDTIPANSLILYAQAINDMQGSPDKSLVRQHTGATVLTIGSHLAGYNAGTIQLLFLDNGQTFTRMIWGEPAKYTEWNRPLEKRDFVGIMAFSKDLKEGRYTDLNKLPVNTTVSYSLSDEETSLIANYPSKVPGTVRTISCDLYNAPGQFQICVDRNNTIYHRILWGDPSYWTPWKSESTEIEKIKPSISLFQNIGIIGDSYASGELYVDGNYIDHYDISWGQILARKNGIRAINFSKGGLTTRDWLVDDHGLSLLNSSDPQDLYLIALGINDYSKLGDAYLGAENDVNTQANTFYGNYGKIITAIRAKAPQAKIVLSTMSYDGQGTAHNYNEAIKTLAQHFGLPVIEQNNDALFTSDLYLNHMVGGHPTAPVYAAMANAFQRLIEKSMIDNFDYFMTYKQ